MKSFEEKMPRLIAKLDQVIKANMRRLGYGE